MPSNIQDAQSLLSRIMGGNQTPQQAPQQQGQRVPTQAPIEQPLPYMAVGRTNSGEPYYGDGVKGWFRRMWGRTMEPNRYVANEQQFQTGQERLEAFRNFTRNFISEEQETRTQLRIFQALGMSEEEAQTAREGFERTSAMLLGNPANLIEYGTAATWEVGVTGLTFGGLQAIGEGPFRKQFSAANAYQEIADMYDQNGNRNQANRQSAIDRLLQNSSGSAFGNVVSMGYNILRIASAKASDPNQGMMDALASAAGSISSYPFAAPVAEWLGLPEDFQDAIALGLTDQERDILWRNLQASEMVYTGWIDRAAQVDAQRRIAEGENPDFVVEELQNPWAEFGGGMVFDLTNIFDIAGIGNARHARRITGTAMDFLGSCAPEAEKILAQAANAADDVASAAHGERALGAFWDAFRGSAQRATPRIIGEEAVNAADRGGR